MIPQNTVLPFWSALSSAILTSPHECSKARQKQLPQPNPINCQDGNEKTLQCTREMTPRPRFPRPRPPLRPFPTGGNAHNEPLLNNQMTSPAPETGNAIGDAMSSSWKHTDGRRGESGHHHSHSHGSVDDGPIPLPVVVGASVGGVLLLLAVVALLLIRRHKKRGRIAAALCDNVALNTSGSKDPKHGGTASDLGLETGISGPPADAKSAARLKQEEAAGAVGEIAGSSTMARALSVQFRRWENEQLPLYRPGGEAARPPVYATMVQPRGSPGLTSAPPVYDAATLSAAPAEPPVYEIPLPVAAGRHTVPGGGPLRESEACA